MRRLAPGESVAGVAGGCLGALDSRAAAALLKELARAGLPHRAQELFDHVLALGPAHEAAARLADVYTYTAAISNCVGAQQASARRPLWRPVTQLYTGCTACRASTSASADGLKAALLKSQNHLAALIW